jgi:hypothetical protein
MGEYIVHALGSGGVAARRVVVDWKPSKERSRIC